MTFNFICGNVYVSILFSQFIPPSPSTTVSISLFTMSVSPLLPCKWVHQYHLSKFHTYVLLLSHPVMSNFLQRHGLQHTRPPCSSPFPEVFPSSCSLHWWCHPAISSSDALFSYCPQFFPASGSFPMSWLFTSDDQNSGASASASVLPTSIQD